MKNVNTIVMGVLGLVTAVGLMLPGGEPKAPSTNQSEQQQPVSTAKKSCCANKETLTAATTGEPASECSKGSCSANKSNEQVAAATKTETTATVENKAATTCPGGVCPSTLAAELVKTETSKTAVAASTPAATCKAECDGGPTCCKGAGACKDADKQVATTNAGVTKDFPPVACESGVCTSGITKFGSGSITFTSPATGSFNLPAFTISGSDSGDVGNIVLDSEPSTCTNKNTAPPVAPKINPIAAKLNTPWKLELKDATLPGLVEALQKQLEIPVSIDSQYLAEAGDDIDQIRFSTKSQPGLTIDSELSNLLSAKEMSYTIPASMDRLIIAPTGYLDRYQYTSVYSVNDLVPAIEPKEIMDEMVSLVQMIPKVAANSSWSENGGSGQIWYYRIGNRKSLVIRNHYQAHREVEELLNQLRSLPHDPAMPVPMRSSPATLELRSDDDRRS
jgi:hypothetical protein